MCQFNVVHGGMKADKTIMGDLILKLESEIRKKMSLQTCDLIVLKCQGKQSTI